MMQIQGMRRLMHRSLVQKATYTLAIAPPRSGQTDKSLFGPSIKIPVLTRTFATERTADTSYELLKKDFRKWLRREVGILSLLLVTGVTGVYFYKNRESSPARQVAHYLKLAEQSAKQQDREQALKHCLHAYAIVKDTNNRDSHLFEFAFGIAAQYETLGKGRPATTYYLEAISYLPYIREDVKRNASHMVVLDRIAQCYQNRGEERAAENYYRQAITLYDRIRHDRVLNPSASSSTDVDQIDQEIPAVMYNYGQLLIQQQRWQDARSILKRSLQLANQARLSNEYLLLIDGLLQNAKTMLVATSKTIKGDNKIDNEE